MKDRQSAHADIVITSANACRIPIFSPTRRPQAVTAWRVETPWGVITGRLGQQHRDLLDAARMVAEKEEWTADGKMHLKVDLARLRSALGGDATNMQRIEDWLEDLRVAQVVIYIREKNVTITGGIVSEVLASSDKTVLTSRAGAFASNRKFKHIEFSTGWSKLIETDRAMKYPLRQVVGLKHGFSQAVARYCLSHANVRDTVAGLAQKLNAGGRLRDRRDELAEDAAGLAAMGITIDGDKITTARDQSPVKRDQSPVSATKVR